MDIKVGDYVKIVSGKYQFVGSGSVVSLVPSRKSVRISAGFINILVKVKDVKVKEFAPININWDFLENKGA